MAVKEGCNVQYCPKCGKEVKEGDLFCEDCGAKLEYENNKPLKSDESIQENNEDKSVVGKKGIKKIGIIVGILIIIGIILIIPVTTTLSYTIKEPYIAKQYYLVQQPYTVTVKHSTTLISDSTYTVPARKYEVIPVYIDTSGKSNILVSGYIKATTGLNIDFYIKDRLLNNYVYGPVKVTYRSFGFVPDNSGYYDFYLDNTYSIFTNKLPEISATMSWENTVTKYREVNKYKLVTKYGLVTKHRRVTESIYKLL